ncbi:MAG: 1-deoxy-D-xylulose-5-phosphate reductoisomerase [Micavibrio sp.]|nr:1-deoxy-D-xylulose-5-phosphate reductoisomerase [Micavibrio sp.]
MSQSVNILGATGSIGSSTLDIINAYPEEFSVFGVSAHSNVEKLAEIAMAHKAKCAVIADETQYDALKEKLKGTDVEVLAGAEGLKEMASEPVDISVAAITGMAALEPTLAAIENSKKVAFASKECLVGAGKIMMDAVEKSGTVFLPVDSEHNAIFQVFETAQHNAIERLILTASGGPFRTRQDLSNVTTAEALAHPNWDMGKKISVDSSTMMNKALEIIEAHYLFNMPAEKIDVIVHPQSIVHSMVEYKDGSVLAQLGAPDMRTPITYCLGYPERIETTGDRLSLADMAQLNFEAVDDVRFPAIRLAYEALNKGQEACIAFNAANEILVAAFLENEIAYLDISAGVEYILNTAKYDTVKTIQDVLVLDKEIREQTRSLIQTKELERLRA